MASLSNTEQKQKSYFKMFNLFNLLLFIYLLEGRSKLIFFLPSTSRKISYDVVLIGEEIAVPHPVFPGRHQHQCHLVINKAPWNQDKSCIKERDRGGLRRCALSDPNCLTIFQVLGEEWDLPNNFTSHFPFIFRLDVQLCNHVKFFVIFPPLSSFYKALRQSSIFNEGLVFLELAVWHSWERMCNRNSERCSPFQRTSGMDLGTDVKFSQRGDCRQKN